MTNNFLANIYIISTKAIPQILINRAAVLGNIIDKYSNISGQVYLNKDKNIEFDLYNNKKKLKLVILDAVWGTFKIGRKKAEGVLLNRTYIIPLLEELNGVSNE